MWHEKFKECLFGAIEASCLQEGGDGDSMFIHEEYEKYADEFEQWLNDNGNTWWKRDENDDEDYITFGNDQECIWFSNDPNKCPWARTVITADWIPDRKV